MSTEADIVEKCIAFVTEQSAGEWDDKTIRQDAEKLAAFVRAERDAVRIETIHECIEMLATYRGHAWYNAAAAALRSLLRHAEMPTVIATDQTGGAT